jgi:predicted RND superfamily exporter protein
MMDAFARWLVRHPVAVLAANLIVTAVLGVYAVCIRVENSLHAVLPKGDPATEYYEMVRRTFGGDNVAVVGMRCEDLFATATLEKLAGVTNALAKIQGVERVVSLTNAPDPAANLLSPPPLLSAIPPPIGEIEALKTKLKTSALYGKNLVADDFKGAAINIFFKNLSDTEYADLGIDEKIQAVLDAVPGPERFYYTGAAHITHAGLQLMRHDLERFTPIALGLVLVCFWFSFWTVRGVVLPTASILMALTWTLGIMVLCGKSITIGTFVLPPLLLVIGSSYAIHVLARYYEQVDAGAPEAVLVVRAFQRVWLPLTISAATNIIGFGSLMVNHITAIWDLGLFAVVGLVCLTVTSLTFIPAALHLWGRRERRGIRSGKVSPILSAALGRIGEFAFRRQREILALSGLIAVVAGIGALFLRVDSNFLYYFKPTSRVRHDNEVINREIAGSNPFYLVIEADEPGLLRQWAVLKQIKDLQQFLLTLPGITSSISLVDYLELLETAVNKGGEGDVVLDEQGNIIPPPPPFWQDPKSLEPILKTVESFPDTFKGLVTADYRLANVLVRTSLTGSQEIERTLTRIREYVAKQFPSKLRVQMTGNLVLLTGTASDIVAGQIKSLSLALAVIFLVMALMFLSVRIGLLAILPNVLPVLLFFGVMGWSGIFLNLGTSLIGAIALGIAVDSTVHYMARLSLELKRTTEQAKVIVKTLQTVGIPILYATVALLAGFLICGFSNFVPIQQFGVLASLTMAAALVANLVLLPALLATTKIITVWDLISVRLGREPQKTIPLFAGLRAAQARIVALMGELRSYKQGEAIVRQGELGDEMYVLINGRADVLVHSDGQSRRLRELRRGDVFGEMGLIRKVERTADVVASEDVEVMAMNERILTRVQRRYPRIAAKMFLNISKVLSDRLESQTDKIAR